MKLTKNKGGMYEYVLTKSIMLIFIVGLMSIFYVFYNNLNVSSAEKIADLEAQRIANMIDQTIGFRGMSTTKEFRPTQELKVGDKPVEYNLIIRNNAIVIDFTSYPYGDTIGIATFGFGVEDFETIGEINCDYGKIIRGDAELTFRKEDEFLIKENSIVRRVTLDIEGCESSMSVISEIKEGDI